MAILTCPDAGGLRFANTITFHSQRASMMALMPGPPPPVPISGFVLVAAVDRWL